MIRVVVIPIGSMYAVYGNISHQYTPFMLVYMPAPWIRHGIVNGQFRQGSVGPP